MNSNLRSQNEFEFILASRGQNRVWLQFLRVHKLTSEKNSRIRIHFGFANSNSFWLRKFEFILASRSQNRFWLQYFRVHKLTSEKNSRIRIHSGFAKSESILAAIL